ncbi:hypothetical protein TNIN_180491 [Trichonephila inaurata madagascariensis]|uniref:Uncharacterized protein n=1 Tax=Trichonephila inaurata madagascariensis TaxID=2747483 RepID=A0A8X6WY74_9ARAC|nr:hypothetical protein TNIN_180491 [Trichonephila inaurata madagascariensis]
MSCNADIESKSWLTFFWNVENYSYCWQKNDSAVFSPSFKVGMIENAAWQLLVYPNEDNEEDFISYFLRRACDDNLETPEIEYELAILAEDGSVLQINERERMEEDSEWGSELFFLRQDVKVTRKEAFLSKDTLRFRCRVWRTDGQDVTPARFFARTVLNVKNWNFLWNIEGFSSLKSDETAAYEIRSESESVDMVFSISMNEKGIIMICMEYIDTSIHFLKFQSFITVTNGTQIDCGKRETSTFVEDVLCTLPFTKKYLMDNKNLYLENDVLALYCECSWSDGFAQEGEIERIDYGILSPSVNKEVNTKSCSPPTEVSPFDKMLDLKEDFHCLYAEGIFSDVKLRTTTQTFPAHKNILSIRSPVFRAMFTTDMKEKIQKCVDISDLEDDTYAECYCTCTPTTWKTCNGRAL